MLNMDIIRQKILVLSSAPYSFKDDATGKTIRGNKIQYLLPLVNKIGDEHSPSSGHDVSFMTVAYDLPLVKVPGIYTAQFELKNNRKNGVMLECKTLEFDNDVDLSKLVKTDGK